VKATSVRRFAEAPRTKPTPGAAVCSWAAEQADNPGLSEAIRRLIAEGLAKRKAP
jgi:hypothetical protein